jgi:hypothetical protein
MHRVTRRAQGQVRRNRREPLPDGVGGTITGGPMQPIDLMEILARGSRAANRGGAVTGAAHLTVIDPDRSHRPGQAVSLSDGSRITFSSVDDVTAYDRDETRELSEA